MDGVGKYLEISKTYMKSQLVWRADVIFNMIFTVSKILFAYLLWSIIFENMAGEYTSQQMSAYGGMSEFTEMPEFTEMFTFHGMLSYYIVNSFLSQIDMSDGISNEIHDRIRNGTFSKYMVIPVRIQGYFMAMEFGVVLFYLLFDFAAAVVWIFVFRIEFVFTGSLLVFICAVIMAILGLLFMVQLNYFLGLLTLKYQGIGTFLMIKHNLMALVTGSIVPLALFPEAAVNIMRVLPFYYVTYLPSMLFTGMCQEEAVSGLYVIAVWCLIMQCLIHVTWNKYIRKYDGVGI